MALPRTSCMPRAGTKSAQHDRMKAMLLTASLVAFAVPALPPPAKAQAPPTPRRTQSDKSDCAAQIGTLPTSWDGQAFAIDGQTLGAVGLKPHIRIGGIQAPKLRDAANVERVIGMRARAAIEDLLEQADHKVRCQRYAAAEAEAPGL
jgi:endonuclease YncB( thermonuclease family)